MSEPEAGNTSGAAATNPYAAPMANVARPPAEVPVGDLIEGGRKVPAGRGAAWLAGGFSLFKKSPWVWIGVTLLFIFGSMLLAIVPIVGSLALNLLLPVFFAGLMLGCRALENDEPLEVAHLFAGFKENVGQLVLVGVLYMVGMMVIMIGVAVVGGVGFFAVFAGMGGKEPGPEAFGAIAIIALLAVGLSMPLVMAFWFAPCLVVFHEQDAVAAMKHSFYGCLKNILPFLVYGILGFLLMLLTPFTLFLGLLVLWPVMMASMYTTYRDIFAPGPDSA